jgi:hypothetical protein
MLQTLKVFWYFLQKFLWLPAEVAAARAEVAVAG